MATIPGPGIATQSQIKLPTTISAPPKAPPAPPAPPPAPKPSTVVTVGKPKEDLGLYTAAKAAPPADAPTAKSEVLETNENGVVAGTGRVMLDIEASDSGYANKIYYSTDNFKTKQYVGIDNQTGTVDLGTFKPGTTIQFGIDNGQGDFFTTGGKSANADKVDHTQVSKLADGGVRVGFEDLRGGGDRDFNDAIIKVRSVPVAPPPVAPAASSVPAQRPVVLAATAASAAPVTPKDAAPKPAVVVAKPEVVAPVITKEAPAKPAPAPVAGKDAPPKPATPEPAAGKDAPPKPATPASAAAVVTNAAVKPATPAPTAAVVTNVAVKPATPAPVPVATKDAAAKPATPAAAPAPAVKPATTTTVTPAAKPVEAPAAPSAAKPAAATPAAPSAAKPAATTPAAPAKAVEPSSSTVVGNDKGNRSGLGDGTNPGQGAGTVKSPNLGTLNPGGLR